MKHNVDTVKFNYFHHFLSLFKKNNISDFVPKRALNRLGLSFSKLSMAIQRDATYDLDRKKIYLISNKSFRYYNL